jgi:tetratricopeptide (TPR) repeat protein
MSDERKYQKLLLALLAMLALGGFAVAHAGASASHTVTTHADSLKKSDDYGAMGNSEYEPGHLEAALTLFDSSLMYNMENAHSWHGKGSTLARMNEHEAAQAAFDEALRIRPDYRQAWWHRGCDNAVAGRVDTALTDLQHAIALDSTVKSWPFQDECWKTLWNDPRLLKVTAPYDLGNAGKE